MWPRRVVIAGEDEFAELRDVADEAGYLSREWTYLAGYGSLKIPDVVYRI
jgi:hypothetical protein